MKLSLRQKAWVFRGMGVLVFVLIFLIPLKKNPWFLVPAFGDLIALIYLNQKWWRCPNCGKWLGSDMGEYCRHCGGKLDYDAK